MTAPAIVTPVSRELRVADPARSAAFYRDILGFVDGGRDGAAVEVQSGPARIRLSPSGVEPGRRVVFFATDDVAAMRRTIESRGGRPSELEDANWIKMRIFEVRDPDGHTLWFAQSYAEPVLDRKGQLRQMLPELPLADVAAGVAYYRDVLGFSINYQQHDLGVMDRDEVTLLLIARTEEHRGIGSCEVYIENADALYAELAGKGARVLGPPVSHPWGLRDFRILDPEGNRITFAQPFE